MPAATARRDGVEIGGGGRPRRRGSPSRIFHAPQRRSGVPCWMRGPRHAWIPVDGDSLGMVVYTGFKDGDREQGGRGLRFV